MNMIHPGLIFWEMVGPTRKPSLRSWSTSCHGCGPDLSHDGDSGQGTPIFYDGWVVSGLPFGTGNSNDTRRWLSVVQPKKSKKMSQSQLTTTKCFSFPVVSMHFLTTLVWKAGWSSYSYFWTSLGSHCCTEDLIERRMGRQETFCAGLSPTKPCPCQGFASHSW